MLRGRVIACSAGIAVLLSACADALLPNFDGGILNPEMRLLRAADMMEGVKCAMVAFMDEHERKIMKLRIDEKNKKDQFFGAIETRAGKNAIYSPYHLNMTTGHKVCERDQHAACPKNDKTCKLELAHLSKQVCVPNNCDAELSKHRLGVTVWDYAKNGSCAAVPDYGRFSLDETGSASIQLSLTAVNSGYINFQKIDVSNLPVRPIIVPGTTTAGNPTPYPTFQATPKGTTILDLTAVMPQSIHSFNQSVGAGNYASGPAPKFQSLAEPARVASKGPKTDGTADAIEAGQDETCAADSERCVRIVKWVQRKLKDLGYFDKPLDGLPGEDLARAIRQFKRDNGISGGADEIDEALINALRGDRPEENLGVRLAELNKIAKRYGKVRGDILKTLQDYGKKIAGRPSTATKNEVSRGLDMIERDLQKMSEDDARTIGEINSIIARFNQYMEFVKREPTAAKTNDAMSALLREKDHLLDLALKINANEGSQDAFKTVTEGAEKIGKDLAGLKDDLDNKAADIAAAKKQANKKDVHQLQEFHTRCSTDLWEYITEGGTRIDFMGLKNVMTTVIEQQDTVYRGIPDVTLDQLVLTSSFNLVLDANAATNKILRFFPVVVPPVVDLKTDRTHQLKVTFKGKKTKNKSPSDDSNAKRLTTSCQQRVSGTGGKGNVDYCSTEQGQLLESILQTLEKNGSAGSGTTTAGQ